MNMHHQFYPLEYFLQTQHDLGVKTIEFWGGNPHFYIDAEYYQDNCEELRKMMAEQYDIRIGAFTPECACYQFQIAAWEGEIWKKSIEYYKKGLEAASRLGAGIMQITCAGGAWDKEREFALERAIKALRILGPVAADNGVTITVETLRPEESNIVTTMAELKTVLDAVDHPNVKAAVDTCAMGVACETLEQWFACFGSDIRHMHFIDGKPYGHLVWGEGNHVLEDWLQVLNDNNYEGLLGQELTVFDYRFRPAKWDRQNVAAFEPYFSN